MDLSPIVGALLSPDNALRNAAEAKYNEALTASLPAVAQGLLALAARSPDETHRAMGAVLLKRAISPHSGNWQRIDPASQGAIRSELLGLLAVERRGHLLRKLCYAAAAITSAGAGGHTGEWPELVQYAIGAAANPADALQCEAGYLLLGKICECNDALLSAHVAPLQPLLTAGMAAGVQPAVQLEAVRAACSLVLSLPDHAAQRSLCEAVLPNALQAIAAALADDELHARELLQALVEAATSAAKAFGSQLGATCNAMLQVAGYDQLDAATRTTAIELLVTLCEQAASVVRTSADAVRSTCEALLKGMAEVESDEKAWCATAYVASDKADEYDEEEEVAVAAEEALERVVSALGPAAPAPCFALVSAMSTSPDWRQRRAALNAVSALGAFCTKHIKREMKQVVPFAVQSVNDASQRVRYAALETLAVLSDGFPGTFQRINKGTVVPAFCAALRDPANCERVKGHTAAAISTFAHPEQCPASALQVHLDALLSALIPLLQVGSLTVKEQALTAVAMVAEVAEADFGRYYEHFVPGLKSIIMSASAPEMAELRGKAIESMSMVAEAVGRDRFVADATEIMSMIMGAKGGAGTETSNLDSYVMGACARICKVMGADSLPYLPHLIPPLLEGAKADIGFKIEDADDDADAAAAEARREEREAQGLCSVTLDIRGMGDKRVCLNVAATQEKEDACRTLFEYADSLGAAFAPFVPQVAETTLPLVSCRFSSAVRVSCAFIFARLLKSAVDASKAQGQPLAPVLTLLNAGVTVLLSQLDVEHDAETRVALAEAVSDAMQVCCESGGLDAAAADGSYAPAALQPPAEAVSQMVVALLGVARKSVERRAKIAQQEAEGAGEEEIENLRESEDDLMTNIVDAIGYSLKTLRSGFLPIFDKLVAPFFRQYLSADEAQLEAAGVTSLAINAVCVFDDAIEFCGAGAHAHLDSSFPVFCAHMRAEDLVLRQCALYGIAKTAEHAAAYFAQHLPQVLPMLIAVVNEDGSRDEDHECATENAIAAVGKMLRFHKDSAVAVCPGLLPMWLSWLPLKADEMEAKVMHAQLLGLVQQQEPSVLAATELLISVIAGALAGGAEDLEEEAYELLSDETKTGFVSVLRQLPREKLAAVGAALPPMQQQALQQALS